MPPLNCGRLLLVSAVIFFSFFANSTGQSKELEIINARNNVTDVQKNLTVVEQWEITEKNVKNIVNMLIKAALPQMLDLAMNMNMSSTCMKDLMSVIGGIKNLRPWAFKFLDASAKMVDGMLTGTLASFGDYDECVNNIVKEERRGKNYGKIKLQGKYCMVNLKLPMPPKPHFYRLNRVLDEFKNFSQRDTIFGVAAEFAYVFYDLSLRFGFCLPSGCSQDDFQKLATMGSEILAVDIKVSRCEIKQENEFSTLQIVVIFAFSFVGFLVLLATLLDVCRDSTKTIYRNIVMQILLSFSLVTNFQKFINTKKSANTISCLHGIRFFGMSWIILGHSYYFTNFNIFRNTIATRTITEDFAFLAVANGSFAVDTFFFMSGMLVCYLAVKLVKEANESFDTIFYVIHRVVRVMPPYVALILFAFLINLLGSGPVWFETTHPYVDACYKRWWANIIFANNFVRFDEMCWPHTWYMAADMQYHIAALVVLIPILRWPKIGISLASLFVITSIIFDGVFTVVKKFPPISLPVYPDQQQTMDYVSEYYLNPITHAGPYFVGVIAGYLIATKPNLKMPKKMQVIGWCCAIACNMSVLFGVYKWSRGNDYSGVDVFFYSGFNRTAWSLGLTWLTVCCATGHGGVINYILSLKMFIPLGRLTYIAYLIHPVAQILSSAYTRNTLQMSHPYFLWKFFANLVISYGLAFVASMCFEAPAFGIEKIILEKIGILKKDGQKEENEDMKDNLEITKKVSDKNIVIPIIYSKEKNGVDNDAFTHKL